MSLSFNEMARITQEVYGKDIREDGYHDTDLELHFETSTHLDVAVMRISRAISTVGIPYGGDIDVEAFEHLLRVRPDWQTVSTADWIQIAKDWWLENHTRYGFDGLPALPIWDKERNK